MSLYPGEFLKQSLDFLRLVIHVTKHKQDAVAKIVKLYKRVEEIVNSPEIDEDDELFVKKLIKKFNLKCKINEQGEPIDITDKKYQKIICELKSHASIEGNDVDGMITYAIENNLELFSGVMVADIMAVEQHKDLFWEYIKALFYLSQLSLMPDDDESEANDAIYNKLEEVLGHINELEKNKNLAKMYALDKFMKKNIITGLDPATVMNAKAGVLEMFEKKGLGKNPQILKMVNVITDRLSTSDMSNGNPMDNIMTLAQEVASTLMSEMENGEDFNLQENVQAMASMFTELMSQDGMEGDEMAQMVGQVISMTTGIAQGQDESPVEMLTKMSALMKDCPPELVSEIQKKTGATFPVDQ